MIESEIFIRNMKNWLKEKRLNYKQLAERIGYASTANYFNGNQEISYGVIKACSEATGLSIRELFTPNEEQFGEILTKDEQILELQQELTRAKIAYEKLGETLIKQETVNDNKIIIDMNSEETHILFNGFELPHVVIDDVNIYNKTANVVIKFDELTVK